jgi:bud site selection protein 31
LHTGTTIYFVIINMPLPKRWNKKNAPPPGFEIIEATLEALEHELRDKIKETNEKKRKTESVWPVHQINWQKSRYVYDMYYTYGAISRTVYEYCLQQKLVDAALIAKWKKPGYERLCSTYVINPSNYKFGTTSICRVPMWDRSSEQKTAQDPTTGCLGCASGKDAGPRNIFGNKYGQYLAAVQMAREERIRKLEEKRRREEEQREEQAGGGDDEDDEETDEDTEDGDGDDESDYGPQPAAGIWAGSQKLQNKSEQMVIGEAGDDDGDAETDDDGDVDDDDDDEEGPALPPPSKKIKP